MSTTRVRGSLARTTLVVALIAAAGCSNDPPTRTDFIEHGLDGSTLITSDADRDMWRTIYGCVYDDVADNESVLRDFVASPRLSDMDSEPFDVINMALARCIAAPSGGGAGDSPDTGSATDATTTTATE